MKETLAISPETFLEIITKNSPAYVMVADKDGRIEYVNRVTKNLSINDVYGKFLFDFTESEVEKEKIKNCLAKALESKEQQLIESRLSRDSGEVSIWESRVCPVIEEGEVTGFTLFSNNITDRKASEHQNQIIFDKSSDFLCILQFNGYLSRVSPSLVNKLGYTEKELLNTHFIDLIHPDDREKTLDAASKVNEQNDIISRAENRCLTRSGETVVIQWSGTADFEGKRIIGVGRDITEMRLLEDELQQAQKLEAVGLLAGGIAHDFNNSLMAISANAELGQMSEDLDELKRRFQDIQKASVKAAQLANKLLTFSRNQPVTMKNVDLNTLVQETASQVNLQAPGIEVITDLAAEKITVKANRAQIEQVLRNLCTNSMEACGKEGKIKLSTSISPGTQSDSKEAIIEVEDTGRGIEKNILNKVFDPFFTTKKEAHGAGLGLATAYGSIKKHKGSILIKESTSSGTLIQIKLPASHNLPDEAKKNTANQKINYSQKTILIAEDETLVADVARSTLQKSGYQVLQVSNGLQAVEACRENSNIDLVFLDVLMPEMNGTDAAKEIHALRPNLPILFASGYSPESSAEMLDGFPILDKPYRSDALLDTIQSLIDSCESKSIET